jgi:bifunctional UDP-N-acetylglucosamine pyrophosphorylase/glucosamine-1-phosphate N-acetyltransferase
MQATAIILAAGLGTRMKSSLPKTLHRLAGRSMLRHLLASCSTVFDRIVVVLGPDMDAVRKEAEPHVCVVQQERLGTAHAALQAIEHFGTGQVAVLYADNPLIRPATMLQMLQGHAPGGLSLLAFRPVDPARYGRVITDTDGLVSRIVEYGDASPRSVRLTCATPACCAAMPPTCVAGCGRSVTTMRKRSII